MQGQYVGGAIASAPYWYTVYNTGIFASPIFTGFLTFWSSLILFQTLVPISLYITVEVCKLVQVMMGF
jgi:phospholipid-translocating ATPase